MTHNNLAEYTHPNQAQIAELHHVPEGTSAVQKFCLSILNHLSIKQLAKHAHLGQIDIEEDWLLGVGNLNSAKFRHYSAQSGCWA